MNKTILFVFAFAAMGLQCLSQVPVTEDVRFDYYQSVSVNDFTNHFSNGNGLVQLTTNGITGGSLDVPDSINWGNDNAFYCSRFHPFTGDTLITSICFRYDAASYHPGTFQRALSIWLIPYADFNHYIIGSVTGNHRIELLTYSWVNNPYPPVTLTDQHWYRLTCTVVIIGGVTDDVSVKAEVFDLGTSGVSVPALVNSDAGIIHDSTLVADTSIAVAFSGAAYAGAAYIDDFHFEGREGFTNCINVPTGMSSTQSRTFRYYPVPASEYMIIENPYQEEYQFEIFNSLGQKSLSTVIGPTHERISLMNFPAGIYLVRFSSVRGISMSKLIIDK